MTKRYAEGLQLFSNSSYRLFAVMFVLSNAGFWTLRIGISWLAWNITQSSSWLGAIAFAEFFPLILFSTAAGALVDRYDIKRITLLAEISLLFMVGALLALTMLKLMTAELLFFLAACIGTAIAISQPTQLSWFPTLLVRKGHIASATNINNLSFNASRFIGPAIAGTMIVKWSVNAVFIASLASYLASAFLISRIRSESGPTAIPAKSNFWQDAVDGYKYVLSNPRISFMFLIVGCTAVGGRGVPELAPAIADLIFKHGSAGFSALVSAAGLGAIASSVWNMGRDKSRLLGAAHLVLVFSLGMACSIMLLCLSSNFYVGLFAFFLLGFCITVTAINSQAIIQTVVAQEYRGRVNALYFLIFRGGTALGALLMGIASTYIGLKAVLLSGAALCFLSWLILKAPAARLFASPQSEENPVHVTAHSKASNRSS